jgi:NADH-quinone oxidoreductase subunit D
MFIKIAEDDPVLHARLSGVGVLKQEQALRYGVLGPTARASGVDIDTRRDDPYALYAEVPWDVVVLQTGDVLAKAKVRLLECLESIRIIRGCLSRMGPGEIWQEVGEIPAGEGIGRAEAPRGEVLHYVRSDGSNMPVRHKIRAPSYMNVPSNEVAVIGGSIADAAITLAAVDPCYCCTERMAVARQGDKCYTWKDLLRLSWEKTELLKERYR